MLMDRSRQAIGLALLLSFALLTGDGLAQQSGYPQAGSPGYPAAQQPFQPTQGQQPAQGGPYGAAQPRPYAPPGAAQPGASGSYSPATSPRPAAAQPVEPGQPYGRQVIAPPNRPTQPANPTAPNASAGGRPAQPAAVHTGPLTEADIQRMTTVRPGEHPLMPALRWARSQQPRIAAIPDYTAVLVKRERVDGELGEQQYLYLKVRHEPFSVYLSFLGPEDVKGQEVIYIEGRNNGEMWAHGTGMKKALGTLSLNPTGMVAMQGQRYPITEIGLLNLVTRLAQVAENDSEYGECSVQFYKNATLGDRPCVCMQVVHPVPRREFRFHLARIYVDRQLNLPIRYESYGWPTKQGEAPPLLEQYTYTNLKLNAGLTDADFDTRNPNYQFP